jgi:hypothetical protein
MNSCDNTSSLSQSLERSWSREKRNQERRMSIHVCERVRAKKKASTRKSRQPSLYSTFPPPLPSLSLVSSALSLMTVLVVRSLLLLLLLYK